MLKWFKRVFTIEYIAVAIFDEAAWPHDTRTYDLCVAMRSFNERSGLTAKKVAKIIANGWKKERQALSAFGVKVPSV